LFAQLILVAYQVKTGQDVRLLRVWAVSGVTPLARLLESTRTDTAHFLEDYVNLTGASQENRRLLAELDRLRIENRFLRSELGTAERAQPLSLFQARSPLGTVAARVIGTTAAANSRVIFVDRGSGDGVRPGVAVLNADGVGGKVTAAYPTASQVLLITDSTFAAGVISGRHRVQGTLKGLSRSMCMVDYLQNEELVEVGEWFYTSGEDRIFPRGLPVGQAKVVRAGRTSKEVLVAPSGLARSLEEVLIVVQAVHQEIPSVGSAPLLPPPGAPEAEAGGVEGRQSAVGTDADRLLDQYRKTAESSGKGYGGNPPKAQAAPRQVQPPVRNP